MEGDDKLVQYLEELLDEKLREHGIDPETCEVYMTDFRAGIMDNEGGEVTTTFKIIPTNAFAPKPDID